MMKVMMIVRRTTVEDFGVDSLVGGFVSVPWTLSVG